MRMKTAICTKKKKKKKTIWVHCRQVTSTHKQKTNIDQIRLPKPPRNEPHGFIHLDAELFNLGIVASAEELRLRFNLVKVAQDEGRFLDVHVGLGIVQDRVKELESFAFELPNMNIINSITTIDNSEVGKKSSKSRLNLNETKT